MYILNLHDDSAEELERQLAMGRSLPQALRYWADLLQAYAGALTEIAKGLEIAVSGVDCEVVFDTSRDTHRIEFRGKTEEANKLLAAFNSIDLVWEMDDKTGEDADSGGREGGVMTIIRVLRRGGTLASRRSAPAANPQ